LNSFEFEANGYLAPKQNANAEGESKLKTIKCFIYQCPGDRHTDEDCEGKQKYLKFTYGHTLLHTK